MALTLISCATGEHLCSDCGETVSALDHICTADIIPPQTIGIFKIKSIEVIEDNDE